MIAFKTASDDVSPCFRSPFDDGDDMIEGQIFRGAFLAAILAGVMIPRINICAAEFDVLQVFPYFYISEQPQDAGHLDGEADASNFAIVFSQNFNLALKEQTKRAFPGDDVDRLIGCI
jgi:hypothetical protein